MRLSQLNYSYGLNGVGWGAQKGLENLVYNFKDQLVQRNIGKITDPSIADNQYLQGIDYSYNVRGWLTNINTLNVYEPSVIIPTR